VTFKGTNQNYVFHGTHIIHTGVWDLAAPA